MKRIILASSSPRRKNLLSMLIGNNFEIVESSYEEDNNLNMRPEDLVKNHSLQKARDVVSRNKNSIIIGADTIVLFENEIIGKPSDVKNAIEILRKISGRTVHVISGIAVIDSNTGKEFQESVITKVHMKKMSNQEIQKYVNTGEPLDKAGAFGIQGKGAVLVDEIDGCYFNIVGLPLAKLNSMLEEAGISIFDFNEKKKPKIS